MSHAAVGAHGGSPSAHRPRSFATARIDPPVGSTPSNRLGGLKVVGFGDVLAVLSAFGPCGDLCEADLDGSGDVAFGDLLIVLSAFGPCP